MADRVKYFLLGLLFLVVAGVIAYDRWNAPDETPEMAKSPNASDRWEVYVGQRPDNREPARGGNRELKVTPPMDLDNPPADLPRPVVNRETPPRVETTPREPVATKPPAARTHVIRKGETLEAIAQRYYRTRKGVQWIVDANKLKNADEIFENQKLIIPARAELKPGKKIQKPGKVPSSYVVKSSDGDLYAICRRFYGNKGEGARVARIMEINQLWSAEVKAGTVLKLPAK